MRHAERADDLFPNWVQRSTLTSSYRAFDLNMPFVLPSLRRPLLHYGNDTVITEMGSFLAQMVGTGLLTNKTPPEVVYSSPALRCIQTAHSVLKATNQVNEIKIRIEPALFEFTALYPVNKPKFAELHDLLEAGYNIDLSYQPILSINELLSTDEIAETYSRRVQDVYSKICNLCESERTDGDTILAVGHASTVDLAVGAFLQPPRTNLPHEMINNNKKLPYCCTAVIDRRPDGQWWYNVDALSCVTYSNFTSKINHDFITRKRLIT
ncbi:unnamed protein product [Thelazia callipaeda]|uniref:Phosphoglycerate mutase family protein n=1 Tax=Thelazia callipaeda TaxID=103827 RepID=A0A0N5CKL1_THECL|nr:unnamed protein product [Thelazia callipaeda]